MNDKGYCLTEKGRKTVNYLGEIDDLIKKATVEFFDEYKKLINSDNERLINRDKGLIRSEREMLYFIVEKREVGLKDIVEELKINPSKAAFKLALLNNCGLIKNDNNWFIITEKGEKAAVIQSKLDKAYVKADERLEELLDNMSD
jgi:predicted transcriptional regulator